MKQKFMQFLKHRMVEFRCYGKSIRKHRHSKVMGFLHILRETEIHTILKQCEEWIPILRNKYEKTQTISRFCFTLQILSWREPMQSSMSGNVRISIPWKYSVESQFFSRLWVFQGIRSYLEKPKNPQNMIWIKYHPVGIP